MDSIDANKYYLKQLCTVYEIDQKEMKKYASIIWKCNDAVRPFRKNGMDVGAAEDQRAIALQYLQFGCHDLSMVERSASFLAMIDELRLMVKETVNDVQDIFGEASGRYLAVYEKFFGFMGEQLHREQLNDYSEAQLYRIRSEALVAFGIVFDKLVVPAAAGRTTADCPGQKINS